MGGRICSRRGVRPRPAVVGLAGLALLTGYAGISHGSPSRGDIPEATVRSLEAINSTNGVPDVVQNLVPGALANRDAAVADYRAAGAAAHPLSKPEYLVVWAGKMNAGDLSGAAVARYTSSGSLNPESLAELARVGMKPGLDAMVVVDARRYDADLAVGLRQGPVMRFPLDAEGDRSWRAASSTT